MFPGLSITENAVATRALPQTLPQTPLWQLTALPRPHNRIWGGARGRRGKKSQERGYTKIEEKEEERRMGSGQG